MKYRHGIAHLGDVNRSFMRTLFVIVPALLLAGPTLAGTEYVLASQGNLRALPEASAEVRARIPIAHPVEVLERKGEWAHVRVNRIEGWLATALLGAERPTLGAMLAAYDATSTADVLARRAWAERATALNGDDLRALARLVEVLRQARDDVALARVLFALETRFRSSLSSSTSGGASAKTKELPTGLDNVELVQRLVDDGIPGATDPATIRRLQPIYDQHVAPTAHVYLRTLYELRADAAFVDRELERYRAELKAPKRVPPLERYQEFTESPNVGSGAVAFWLRRMLDGTDDRFQAGLEKLVLIYAPAELARLLAAVPASSSGGRDIHLALPGTFHGDEIAARNGEQMLGLSITNGKARLGVHRVRVELVNDAIVDEPNEQTGKLVAIESEGVDELVVLIGGLEMKPGPVLAIDDPACAAAMCRWRLGARGYEARPQNRAEVEVEVGSTKPRFDLTLSEGDVAQTIPGISRVVFAGDIDGDGKLDVLVENGFHYNVMVSFELYLSKGASPGRLFRHAAAFRSVGC